MKLKWTLEKLQEEANKYETRSEFRENSKGAYLKANKLKITDKLFENHSNNGYSTKRFKNGYWTNEKIQEEINKCKNRTDFWNNVPLYKAASKRNIIDISFKNKDNNGYSKKPNGYWTIEKLQEEIDKYKSRSELRLNNITVYNISYKKKLIDELFKNHPNQGYSNNYLNKNIYTIYVYELPNFNKCYVGLTNNIKRRDIEHIFNHKDRLNLFLKDNNISLPQYKILEIGLNPINAKKQEQYWINLYKQNNWELFNIAKGGSLGGKSFKWTKEKLLNEVKKYNTRSEFSKNGGAYNAAIHLKILDELFENHPNNGYTTKQKICGYWTKEKLQNIANTCNRLEFRKKLDAYNAAIRLNILDELFENHINNGRTIKPAGYWNKETISIIINKYRTKQDLKINNGSAYNAAKRLGILNELFDSKKNS